jgi:hypothetical protein
MLQLTTNKLFYRKYRYKIECRVSGARYRKSPLIALSKNIASTSELKAFDSAVDLLNQYDIKTRCEHNTFSFFFNNIDLEDKILEQVRVWTTSISRPATEFESAILEEHGTQKVLCDALPRGGYKYKVEIKSAMDINLKSTFFEWTGRMSGKIFYSGSTSKWLANSRVYYPEPFIYVRDGPTLSMVLLYLGNNCRRVQEYIPRSSINT